MDAAGGRARDGPARAAAEELHHGASRTRSAIGIIYDSGNYHGTLDAARAARPRGVPARAGGAAPRGIYRGVGFSTYMEICGLAPSRALGPEGLGMQAGYWESAVVRVHPTGAVTVYTGTSPHGQGLETSFAQIVADRLGVDPSVVDVIHGDTNTGPVRDEHVRVALAGGRRRGGRPRRQEGAATRPSGSSPTCSRRRPRTSRCVDGKFRVERLARQGHALAEVAGDAYIPRELPEGMEPGLEEIDVLRPGELRVPVRRARVHRRGRRRDGQRRRRPLHRGRRLRAGDQPDAHRRADPRRHRPRARPGAVRADRLRRERPARHRHVRRLRAPERGGRAELRDRPHRDAVADQLARREGRRRGGDDRLLAGGRQRGDRRAARRSA